MPGVTPPHETLVSKVLELPGVRCIEPAFADLPDDTFTAWMEDLPADQGRLLVDEDSDPLAMAFHTGQGWLAGSFHLREPTLALIEHFEELNGDIFQEDRAVWEEAVREYYSLILMETTTPALEDLNPARTGQVRDLLAECWGERVGVSCLDCGCGSGLGSLLLRERGMRPLSYDNDESLLSLGLSRGRLLPGETMCIDATYASRYCRGAEAGLGLMFGEINAFNEQDWEMITAELLALTKDCLVTVGTEREAHLIQSWAEARRCRVEVRENGRDPIYDRWVCLIERE
ncbi:MAG: hypothetical protein A4E37_01195 [Methanoregulaceae archaeon PtaB.Bin056]|nr:MAG: hypothetical protein A4E37_01195 [Methanoregulaceae archaeon PtaB.Bin056]